MKVAAVGAGITTLAVAIVAAALSGGEMDAADYKPESEQSPTGDIIMSTKSSRPGCEVDDTCYVPSAITILRGSGVTWLNADSAFHSVTSGTYDSPTDLFDSGYLNPSESYTLTFNDAGSFEYFCTLHPWMSGVVIVR